MNRDVGKQKTAWIERYWKFLPQDTVRVCGRHHAEIHLAYDRIIVYDNFKRGKKLDFYTFKEAMALRRKLRAFCNDWLKMETPGKPEKEVFGRLRTKNQRRAKRDEREKKSRETD